MKKQCKTTLKTIGVFALTATVLLNNVAPASYAFAEGSDITQTATGSAITVGQKKVESIVTLKASEHGYTTIYDGERETTASAIDAMVYKIAEGTVLKLTSEANEGYEFSKYVIEDTDGNNLNVEFVEDEEGHLTFKMPNLDISITTEYEKIETEDSEITDMPDEDVEPTETPEEPAEESVIVPTPTPEIVEEPEVPEDVVDSVPTEEAEPTEEPTVAPEVTDTPDEPVVEPTETPEITETPDAAITPTPEPTVEPTPEPTEIPVVEKFKVIIEESEFGVITADVEEAAEGDTVALTAIPNEGYLFVKFSSYEVIFSGESFTMPAEDVTITAVFEKEPVKTVEQTIKADEASVTISGLLPEGATVSVEDMTMPTFNMEGPQMLAAYDIVITDENGEVYQPYEHEATLEVTFTGLDAYNGTIVDIMHLTDEGEEEVVVSGLVIENGTVTFTANSFSIYAVIGELVVDVVDQDAIYKFTYSNGTNAIFYDNSETDLPVLVFDGDIPAYSSSSTGYLQNISSVYVKEDGQWVSGTVNTLKANINASVAMYVKFEGTKTIGKNAFRDCDNIYVNEESFIGVTTIGDYAFYNSDSVTAVDLSDVTSIGTYVFYNCSKLSDVTLSDSLKSIGNYAFYKCVSLGSIDIPASLTTLNGYAFASCTSLTEIDLSHTSITTLASSTFNGCSALQTCILPASISSLGDSVFYNCTALTSLDLSAIAATSIPNSLCYGCTGLVNFQFPSGVTTVGTNVFNGCSSLASVGTLPTGLKSMGTNVFLNCASLTELDFSGCTSTSFTTIPESAFNGCTALETLVLPSAVTTINTYAFAGCSSLTGINMPKGLKTLGTYAFENCTSLTEMDFTGCTSSSFTTISAHVFDGCTALETVKLSSYIKTTGSYAFKNCTALTGIDMPASFYSLGTYTFQGCTALKEIDFSGCTSTSFTTISQYAFQDCASLETIKFPAKLTTIDGSAFKGCSSLNNVSFPSTLTKINGYAFQNCTSLEEVDLSRCTSSSLNALGSFAFAGCSSLKNVVLNNYIVTLNQQVFDGCSALESINLGKVKTIGSAAFRDCYYLEELDLSSVTSLGTNSFVFTGEMPADAPEYVMLTGCSATALTAMATKNSSVCAAANSDGNPTSTKLYYDYTSNTGKPFIYSVVPEEVAGFVARYTDPEGVTAFSEIDIANIEIADIIDNGMKTAEMKVEQDAISSWATSNNVTSGKYYEFLSQNGTLRADDVYYTDGSITIADTGEIVEDHLIITVTKDAYTTTLAVPYASTSLEGHTSCYDKDFNGFCDKCKKLVISADTYYSSSYYYASDDYAYDVATKTFTGYAWYITKNSYGNVLTLKGVLPEDCTNMFNDKRFLTVDFSEADFSQVVKLDKFFYDCTYLTEIDLSGLDFSNVMSTSYMFRSCVGLTEVDFSDVQMPSLLDASYMFYNCNKLVTADFSNFIGSSVGTVSHMFDRCSKLSSVTLDNWDTSNITIFSYLFYECESLLSLDLSGFNTEKATDMSGMFRYCDVLTSIDMTGWVTDNVTTMAYLFDGCSALVSVDITHFNTAYVTSMEDMFHNCSSLEELDVSHLNGTSCTFFDSMFGKCSKLQSLDVKNLVTSSCKSATYMFGACELLTELDLSGWDTSGMTQGNCLDKIFYGCVSLKTLDLRGWEGVYNWRWNESPFYNVPLEEITFSTDNNYFMTYIIGRVVDLYDDTYVWVYVKDVDGNSADGSSVNNKDLDAVTAGGTYKLGYPLNLYAGGGLFADDSTLTVYYYADKNTPIGDLVLPVPTRVGPLDEQYSFVGWAKDGWIGGETYSIAPVDDSTPIGEFTDLYAIWTGVNNKPHTDDDGNGFCDDCERLCIDPATMYSANRFRVFNTDGSVDAFDKTGSWYADSDYYWVNFFNSSMKEGYAWYLNNKGLLTVKGKLPANCTRLLDFSGDDFSYGDAPVKAIDVSGVDTSEVTNMKQMFHNDYFSAVEEIIGLDGFDTSNVTDMYAMFSELNSVTSLDVDGFDTSKVTVLGNTFNNCNSLETLNVSTWDTSNVIIMMECFYGCKSLKTLDLSNWDISAVDGTSTVQLYGGMNGTDHGLDGFEWMFAYAQIEYLDISGWDFPGENCCGMFAYAEIETINVTGVTGIYLDCNGYTGQTNDPRTICYKTKLKTIIVNEFTEGNPFLSGLDYFYSKYDNIAGYNDVFVRTHDANGDRVSGEEAVAYAVDRMQDITKTGTYKLAYGSTLLSNGGVYEDSSTSKTFWRGWDEIATVADLMAIAAPTRSGYNHTGYALAANYRELDESTLIVDGTTYYATWKSADILPSYVVVLPAIIVLEIDEDNSNRMIAEIPYSVTYTLPATASIEVSIPESLTMTNQADDTLIVTSNKQKTVWTTMTVGVITEEDGSLTGTDAFILSAPVEAGQWSGNLIVNIDVTE